MEITSQAQAVLRRVQEFNQNVPVDIARTMDTENQLTVGHIQSKRFTPPVKGGSRFQPALDPKLGIIVTRTNRLRSSVRASRALVVGGVVVSSIGSNVEYAAIHEFGGVIRRTTKAGVTRLRLDKFGQLLRQTENYGDNRAVFAKKRHKNVYEKAYKGGKSYTVNIPARAPITRGIEDRKPDYEAAISKAILDRWNGRTP
jgi:phage gpG-like protein